MFNLASGKLPEAAVMLSQGSPMHQPTAITARQSACDYRDPRKGHDGIFSNCERLINLFLTRTADFTKDQDIQAKVVFPMLKAQLKKIVADTSGATAVEYGLIVSLIVLAMIGALQGVAASTIAMWTDVESQTTQAIAN